jgi:LAO/AO transport system kinase
MTDTGINTSFKRNKRPQESPKEIADKLLAGDRSALSRAITFVESNKKTHQKVASEILKLCLPHSGKSLRIGITGVPGVGKSTFIEAFGCKVVKNFNKKVAVLAVDPSSQKSKGSILGDKTRMDELVTLDNVFVRPSPAGSTLGGVAQKTREAVFLCEAAGYEIILIETVGVGQSETAVKSMVDYFLLLMLAGAGDELQGIKRGIMEMADTIVITKADGGNENNAIKAKVSYQNAVHLFPPHESNWITRVLSSSSLEGRGLDRIWEEIEKYQDHIVSNGFMNENREKQSLNWFHESVKSELIGKFYDRPEVMQKIVELEKAIKENRISSFAAARELLN